MVSPSWIDAEMLPTSMASGPPPMPKTVASVASIMSTKIIQERMINVASQYLARLMRPSKLNRCHLWSIAASGGPELAGDPEYWSHGPASGSISERLQVDLRLLASRKHKSRIGSPFYILVEKEGL